MADSELFRALGDPIRLRIIALLQDISGICCAVPGRVCACDIEAGIGLSQPTVSHHMAILTRAGLVAPEKIGRFVHYTLLPGRFAAAASLLAGIAQRAPARAEPREPAPAPVGA